MKHAVFHLCTLQVQLVQTVIDGVNLLIEMEKMLEKGKSIDSLICYVQKDQHNPSMFL